MYAQIEKPKEDKSKVVANPVVQKKSYVKQGFKFEDNRSEIINNTYNSNLEKPKALKHRLDEGVLIQLVRKGRPTIRMKSRILNSTVGVKEPLSKTDLMMDGMGFLSELGNVMGGIVGGIISLGSALGTLGICIKKKEEFTQWDEVSNTIGIIDDGMAGLTELSGSKGMGTIMPLVTWVGDWTGGTTALKECVMKIRAGQRPNLDIERKAIEAYIYFVRGAMNLLLFIMTIFNTTAEEGDEKTTGIAKIETFVKMLNYLILTHTFLVFSYSAISKARE
jgi:hypothetical protein